MSSSSELMKIGSPAELERGGRILFLKVATKQHIKSPVCPTVLLYQYLSNMYC